MLRAPGLFLQGAEDWLWLLLGKSGLFCLRGRAWAKYPGVQELSLTRLGGHAGPAGYWDAIAFETLIATSLI